MHIESLTFDLKSKQWSAPFPALDSPRTLVLAFGDPSMTNAPMVELKRAYPNSVIAGCSGAGEIVGTQVRDDVLAVTVVKFEHTSIAAAVADCSESSQSFTTGEALAKKLSKSVLRATFPLRAVFVLSDGLNVNGSELVRGLNSVLDDSVIVTGGLAGDGTRFQKTWVAMGESLASGMVAAIGFYGDHLVVSHGSKGGWDKFGPERVVTKAEGNVLYELDGKPALSMYKEYLGEKASGLPATGLLFPLSLRANSKDDKALVRTLLAVDEAKQTMTFAGDMPVGFLAQLMKADFDRLIGGAATAASTAKKLVSYESVNTLAIAVSCVGRRLVLGERTEEEVEAVLDVLPKGSTVTGFYSYGELSPYATGRCDLHNQTMTLTTFAESPQVQPRVGKPVAAAAPLTMPVPVASPASAVGGAAAVATASMPPLPPAPPASSPSGLSARPATPAAAGPAGAPPRPPPAGATATGTMTATLTGSKAMRVETLTWDMKSKQWSGPFPALDSPRTLVLAFGDPAVIENPQPLKDLKRAYPLSLVTGCSGAGEIVGTQVRDEVLSVTVVRFEHTLIAAAAVECKQSSQSTGVGEALAKKLNKPSLRSVFVLSDGLNVNGSELVRGLNSGLDESVIVTGGLAGDGTRFQKTWVCLNDVVTSGAVVAIGFYGDHLLVSHGSKGGWDKFGPERVVTKAEGNVLYELDGKPALSMYKEYLGEKSSGLPATGLLFPLSLRANSKDDKALVRTLLAVDEAKQTMTFAGDMPAGFLAQLMKADFDRLIGGAASAAGTARKLVSTEAPTTLAIAVSCVGRRLVLGERTEEEVEAVLDVLPKGSTISGFYSYGELSPYATGRCDLHNQTMTLTTFAESQQPLPRVAKPVPAVSAPNTVPVPGPAATPPVPPPAAATSAPPRPAPAPMAARPAPLARPEAQGVFEEVELVSDSEVVPQSSGMSLATVTWDMKTKKWSGPFPALDSARTLVLAFGDPAVIEDPAPLRELKKAYPLSLVAGCSGSGEIVGTQVRDEVLSVTVVRFEYTSVAAASAECTQSSQSTGVGETLARKLNKPSLRAVFVLSDGLNVNGSELVRGLNSGLDESVVVTGGLAGDGTRFQKTWVSLNDTVTTGAVVAIGFYGENLVVAHGSKGGWDKFGPERIVTRAEGNVLYELDGKPALSIYKGYLGEKASGLPATGLLFPLSLRANSKDDKALVRTLLAVDEAKQTMTFAGDVPVGYLAQLMKADFDRLIGGAASAATTAKKLVDFEDPRTLAIAVSCVGRRLVLGERTEEEVEAVMEVLPKGATVAGFYSYGELSPYATGRCDLHNQTMTLTTFAESKVARARPAAPPPMAVPAPTAQAPAPVAMAPAEQPRPSAPPVYTAPPPAASNPAIQRLPVDRRVVRPVATDRSPSSKASVEVERQGELAVVRIHGKLSESFKGRDVSGLTASRIVFDLADVERITSFGVREWLQMVADLEPKGAQLFFARCSEAVVNQLGMIRRFAGGGQVLSFFAPYVCGKCGTQFSALIDCEAEIDALKQLTLPDAECPSCTDVGHFDDDARSYLAFGPSAPTNLPPEVRRAVDGLPAVGVLDPIEKSIDGRVNHVRVNCRIDETVRWGRVLDGLEGEVVLELGASPGSTPGGCAQLYAGLRRLPGEVDVVRIEGCPGALLEAIATGQRDPRFAIATAQVEGFCSTCNARRPATIRVEEAVTSLQSGTDPYIVCKRCNTQLNFAAVRPTLRRLGEEGTNPALRANAVGPRTDSSRTGMTPLPMAPLENMHGPAPRTSPAMIALGAIGVVIIALLAVLLGRLTAMQQPVPPAPRAEPTPPVAAAVVAPPKPSAVMAEENALPPAWSEQPFVIEKDLVFVVGRSAGAATEEDALARARIDAELRLVQHLFEQLPGSKLHDYVSSKGGGDLAGNAEAVAARFTRQLGSVASLERTDAALKKSSSGVGGVARYHLPREAFDNALEFYRNSAAGLGMTVVRFFPTLETTTRTDGELIVVAAGKGPAWKAGVRDGDVLLSAEGRPLANLDAFNRAVREAAGTGRGLTLTIESAGVKRTVRVAGSRAAEGETR